MPDGLPLLLRLLAFFMLAMALVHSLWRAWVEKRAGAGGTAKATSPFLNFTWLTAGVSFGAAAVLSWWVVVQSGDEHRIAWRTPAMVFELCLHAAFMIPPHLRRRAEDAALRSDPSSVAAVRVAYANPGWARWVMMIGALAAIISSLLRYG